MYKSVFGSLNGFICNVPYDLSVKAQNTSRQQHQPFRSAILVEESCRTISNTLRGILVFSLDAHHDHRQLRVIVLHIAQHFQSIAFGHIEVEQQEAIFRGSQEAESLISIAGIGKVCFGERIGQNLFQPAPYLSVVVSYQNMHNGSRFYGSPNWHPERLKRRSGKTTIATPAPMQERGSILDEIP